MYITAIVCFIVRYLPAALDDFKPDMVIYNAGRYIYGYY